LNELVVRERGFNVSHKKPATGRQQQVARAKYIRRGIERIDKFAWPECDTSVEIAAAWLAALCQQARVLVEGHRLGIFSHMAPNRRLLIELTINLALLEQGGVPVVDGLRRVDQWEAKKFAALLGPEWVAGQEGLAEFLEQDLDGDKSGDHLLSIKAATEHMDIVAGFYQSWWTETKFSHASLALATAYSIQDDGRADNRGPLREEADHLLMVSLLLTQAVAHVAQIAENAGLSDLKRDLWDTFWPGTAGSDSPHEQIQTADIAEWRSPTVSERQP
jgi:hypothetical protein